MRTKGWRRLGASIALTVSALCIVLVAAAVARITQLEASYQPLDLTQTYDDASQFTWQRALQQQPALAGWLCVTNTPIAYPVVQASDAKSLEYFLSHSVWGEPSIYGSVVLDHLGCKTRHTIAYGHRTELTGLMFGPLAQMYDPSRFAMLGALAWHVPPLLDTRVQQGEIPPPGIYQPLCALRVDAYTSVVRTFPTTDDDVQHLAYRLAEQASARSPAWQEQAASATRIFTLVTCSTLDTNASDRTAVVFTQNSDAARNV